MSAISRAWEHGASAVEVDIHLTADKRVVLIHDADTLRVSGVKKIIAETTLAELKQLDVGRYKGDEFRGERIPELGEALQSLLADGKLVIEIKCGPEVLPFLKTALSEAGVNNSQIELIAFNRKTLSQSKQLMPYYKHLWLLDLDYSGFFMAYPFYKKRLIRLAHILGFDGVNVWAGKVLNQKFISAFHRAGLNVYCWTVNDARKANELYQCGIDGLTTDCVREMYHELTKLNQ